VYSEVNKGTTFKIYLPQHNAPLPKVVDPTQDAPALKMTGNATILLVEDDAGVRDLTKRLLDSWGYRVLMAADAQEAQRIAAAHPDQIDILLTDIIMPGGINGVQLAAQMLDLYPRLRVLYMSGYTDTALTVQAAVPTGHGLLMKPFTLDALAQAIQAALAAAN
jgi:DNA-binding NtrC family response regulator